MKKETTSKPKELRLLGIPAIQQWIAISVIVLITFLLYWPAHRFAFLNWDDDVYITTSSLIQNIDKQGITDIFSSFSNSNYHPLTTLAYALIYKFFGLDSTAYHLLNIVLHLFNVLLVYFLLKRFSTTGFLALFGAAIFAWHPMHIESVAWVSETKDLLYTGLLLLSLLAYLRYREAKGATLAWYILSLLIYLLSCLSKSAAAIFPAFLILIDWYQQRPWKKVWFDKIPFALLALATAVTAVLSQQADQSINMAGDFPWPARLLFAAYGIWYYALNFVFPIRLSALHYFPDPSQPLPAIYYVAGLATAGLIAFILLRLRKRSPAGRPRTYYLGMGLYVAALLMVLQLIPIGRAVVAERYTYLSYLGLIFIAGNWLEPWFRRVDIRKQASARALQALTLVFLGCLLLISQFRIPVWKDSITLFDDVIRKYPDRGYAYLARGNTWLNMKEADKALADYGRAIAREPELGQAYFRRATLLMALGRYQEAIPDAEKAVELLPDNPEAWHNRGTLKYMGKLYPESLTDFRQATELAPSFTEAWKNTALAAYRSGDMEEAMQALNSAIQADDQFAEAWYYRGIFKLESGDTTIGCQDLLHAAQLGNEKAREKAAAVCPSPDLTHDAR